MQNKQKKTSCKRRIVVVLLCIMTLSALLAISPSAYWDGDYVLEDNYTQLPAYNEIVSGAHLVNDAELCAFWIYPLFDPPVTEADMYTGQLLASGVGRLVYGLFDDSIGMYSLHEFWLPIGVEHMEIRSAGIGYWVCDTDTQDVLLELPLTSCIYVFPNAGSPLDFSIIPEYQIGDVCQDASDYGVDLIYGYHSYAVGGQYLYEYAQGIIRDEYERGKSEGYQIGFDEATQTNKTFLDFISAIFTAPSHLINTIFDFELFGFNLANVVKVLLTTLVLGFVVKLFIKYGGA